MPSELSRSRKALGLVARNLKADFTKGWLDETFRNNALGRKFRENVSRHSDLVQQQNMEQASKRLCKTKCPLVEGVIAHAAIRAAAMGYIVTPSGAVFREFL